MGVDKAEAELSPMYVWQTADEHLAKELHALGMRMGELHRRLAPVMTCRNQGADDEHDPGRDDLDAPSQGQVVDRLTFYRDQVVELWRCVDDIHDRLVLPADPAG